MSTVRTSPPAPSSVASARRRHRASPLARHRRRSGLILSLPAVLLVSALLWLPIAQALYFSMTKWNGITATWIGPRAYLQAIFGNPLFWRVLQNNALLLLALPVAIAIPLAIVMLLTQQVWGWRFFRSVYFLPTAISWVVIGIVAVRFFANHGLMNGMLRAVGLGFLTTDMLAQEKTALVALAATFVWSMLGTNIVIFLTGMATLDPNLHDAAQVDGANALQAFIWITLPQLKRFILFATVITMISAFSALFSLIFVMTGGGPGFGTTTLEFFVYQLAFRQGAFGLGALYGIILFAIMAGIGLVQLRLVRGEL